jgi:hypothetical protein
VLVVERVVFCIPGKGRKVEDEEEGKRKCGWGTRRRMGGG